MEPNNNSGATGGRLLNRRRRTKNTTVENPIEENKLVKNDEEDTKNVKEGEISKEETVLKKSETEKDKKDKNEDEKKDEDDEDENKEEDDYFDPYSGGVKYKHVRSGYIPDEKRLEVQSQYMEGLEVRGFLGLKNFPVDKSSIFQQEGDEDEGQMNTKSVTKKNQMMQLDGVYLTDADVRMNSLNINRMEQRLIRTGQHNYFRRDNKELKIDNKIFEEKVFKKNDISLLINPFFGTLKRSAVICQRSNQRKSIYYLMELKVGKLTINQHPLFSEEDSLSADMRIKTQKYQHRVDRSILPHLGEILQTLRVEDDKLSADPRSSESDIALIRKQIEDTKKEINTEKKLMQAEMQEIYNIWKKIKNIRNDEQKYTSTPWNLAVQEYQTDAQTDEQYMLLRPSDISNVETYDGRQLPRTEIQRRNKIKKSKMMLKIYINDNLMAKTDKVNISWPSFEVEFFEKFQIFLYTKPYNVRVDVCTAGIGSTVINSIDLDIPGENVHTLTSASSLIRNVDYKKVQKKTQSKKQKAKEVASKVDKGLVATGKDQIKTGKKGQPAQDDQDDAVTIVNGEKPKIGGGTTNILGEDDDEETENLVSLLVVEEEEKVIHDGSLLVQIGWKGYGPHLPPPNAGGFGVFRPIPKKSGDYKALNGQDSENDFYENELLLDVNDPRNYEIIEKMRNVRNRQMRKLLKNDVKFPLWDVPSLRHKLIKMKFTDPDLMQIDIPLREEMIANDPKLMKFLEKDYDTKIKTKLEKNVQDNEPIFIQTIEQVDAFPQSPETIDRINYTRSILMKRQNVSKLQKTLGINDHYPLEQVIKETRLLGAHRDIIAFVKQIFAQRRKLRPRKKRAKKIVTSSDHKVATFSIHAIKGINIPARKRGAIKSLNHLDSNHMGAGEMSQTIRANEMTNGAMMDLEKLANAERISPDALIRRETSEEPVTYVQARIVDSRGDEHVVSTHSFSGVDPEWNETIQLSYEALNKQLGFTVPELIKNDGILYISVFDFVGSYKKLKDMPSQYNIVTKDRYIGSFSIPLLTLFQNPKMNSLFKLNRPIFLFGYKSEKAYVFASSVKKKDMNTLNPYLPTYINLSISCDPEFELPASNNKNPFVGAENPQLLIMGKAWMDKFFGQKENKNKNVKIWGENIMGHSIFLPKFLDTLQPPPGFPIDKEAYKKAARYVSLIPFKNDSQFFKDLPDIYSTCQQFIDLRAGDYEEHAILLCNYFNYIDKQLKNDHYESFLLLGTGVPEGESIYVLRRDKNTNQNEIWNPITADIYKFKEEQLKSTFFCFTCSAGTRISSETIDSICPLKEVHCVISSQNIFINIQKTVQPSKMKWDTEDKKLFQPFLSPDAMKKYFPSGIQSIQKPIKYEETSNEFVRRLEIKIANHISREIENQRTKSKVVTNWNRKLAGAIKQQLLIVLENYKYQKRPVGLNDEVSDDDMENARRQTLKIKEVIKNEVRGGKEIYGFPLNMPYIDEARVWQEVKNTGIQDIVSEDVEYVLSVAIFPYHNYVMSVWIYIAILYQE